MRDVVGVVVERERARVEAENHPAVFIVEIDGLDPGGSLHHFFLDFESE